MLQQGYRVLALASKFVEDKTFEGLSKKNREFLEQELHFAGLLIFENKLKDQTTPTIQYLKKYSKVNMGIITGDNPLTAISVGKQCGIISKDKTVVLLTKKNEQYKWKQIVSIDEQTNCQNSEDLQFNEKRSHICFAITGNCLDEFLKLTNQNEQLLKQTYIYARMTPNQKALIIERLKQSNEITMMCGDGANDCEAMNKADVSLSLNEGEASLAASFTSQIQQDISSVLYVLKEGQCSLATSISSFKFMTLYSLIQFISVVILYSSCSDFMTPHYILIDIFLLIPLIFTMNRFGPADNLSKNSVPHNLVSLEILSNVLGHVCIVAFFQFFMFWLLIQQNWFIEYKQLVSKNTLINYDIKRGFESTILCWFSCFQYITCAICVCEGKPYRETIYKSFLFLFNFFLAFVLVVCIIIESSEKDITQTFEFKKVPVEFTKLVLQLAFLNMGISYLFELGQRRIFQKL